MRQAHYNDTIYLECSCVGISQYEWDKLMEGSTKANGKKIRQMIKKQLPELYHALDLQLPNPYEPQARKTKTHYIYIHSAIEYFLKRS